MKKLSILFALAFAVNTQFSFASDCATASSITPAVSLSAGSVSGSFAAETYSGTPECAGPDGNPDAWYQFSATQSTMFIGANAGGDLDLAIEAFASCGGLSIACTNAGGTAESERSILTGLTVGATYFFRVYHSGATAAGTTGFTVAVSSVPLVELRPEFCDLDDYTTNDIIKATQPSNLAEITYYQWRFEELSAPFNTYEVISPNGGNPNFRLQWFDDILYGMSYDVSVRTSMSGGSLVGDYSNICEIALQPNVLPTRLESQYAGSFVNFCDVVGAEAVGGADRYRWTFNDLENTVSVFGDGNQRLLRLSKVPNLRLGQTYVVSAFAEVNGMESSAGTLRFLNTVNNVPNTGLNSNIYPCGSTYPINLAVQAFEVCKAENYTWRFRNTSSVQPDLTYTRVGGNRFIRLEWVTGLIVGDTYDVDVKARQGQKNGDYSSICSLTIGESTAPMGRPLLANGDGFAPVLAQPNIELTVLSNGNDASDGISFHISTHDQGEMAEARLYDLSGRLLATRKVNIIEDVQRINWNVPGMTSGIYLLHIASENEIISQKIFGILSPERFNRTLRGF